MRIFAIITSALFFICCQQNQGTPTDIAEASISNETTEMTKPYLIHTVFFWTKEGTSNEQLQAFEKGLKKLGTCPQIMNFYWGPPAPTEARDVVDQSYDYAINVHFASVKDQDEYQNEPIHLEFIENHNTIWEKVIVYDNIVK